MSVLLSAGKLYFTCVLFQIRLDSSSRVLAFRNKQNISGHHEIKSETGKKRPLTNVQHSTIRMDPSLLTNGMQMLSDKRVCVHGVHTQVSPVEKSQPGTPPAMPDAWHEPASAVALRYGLTCAKQVNVTDIILLCLYMMF